MVELTKPKVLKAGDTIVIISPSGPLGGLLPHRAQSGIKSLQDIGFKVLTGQHALEVKGHVSASAEARADDINTAFANKDVKGIFSFIGGFHSNQILPHLDYELIKKNPKVFMGFSDVTVLHYALQTQANLTTFYGPAVLTQFSDTFGLNSYTEKYFRKAVMDIAPIGAIEASQEWTDELLNWFKQEDLSRPRKMSVNSGYKWLKAGSCDGEIMGGCITSMLHLRGTKYWPSYKNKIFFWELPESSDLSKGEPVSRIDAHLTDLELSGVFDECIGMVVGRPMRYKPEEVTALEQTILERTRNYNFPILFNVDVGHTDPIITIPLGAKASLDAKKNLFSINSSGVLAE